MIFPRVRLNPDFENGAPPATLITCHPTGGMQSHICVQWLEHFIQHAQCTSYLNKSCSIAHRWPYNTR